ncbi:MAG: hypothetical protein JNL90_19100 [Planctomycetes bacterium]|nr:hypothetical protein [Planctomycetota bacterium]
MTQAAAPPPSEPWAAARARYASCASYADRGTVVVDHRLPDGTTARAEYTFATAFARPDRFRFEWGQRTDAAERGREVVLHEGEVTRSWPAGASEPWRCSSLMGALAEDAGGAAPRIVSLLLPELFPGAALATASARGTAVRASLEGVDCWRLELASGGGIAVAWLDAERLALRRLEEHGTLGGVERQVTTRFEGQFDVALPEEAFALVAPAAERRLGPLGVLERASGWGAFAAFGLAALALLVTMLLRRRRAT